MRRLLFIISLFILGIYFAYSQSETFHPRWLLGVSVGETFNRYNFSPSVSQHTFNGHTGGLTLRYDVESYASLQVEANYLLSGWSERFKLADGTNDPATAYHRELTYIRMPILTNLHYDYKALRIYFLAGPEFGYLIKERSVEMGRENMSIVATQRHDMVVQKKFSWGITGGVGLGINIFSRQRIEIEGRYTYGYGSIWRTKRIDPYGLASESVITAKLNYLIAL